MNEKYTRFKRLDHDLILKGCGLPVVGYEPDRCLRGGWTTGLAIGKER